MSNMIVVEEPHKVRIRDLNTQIVCSLCAGYFVDATTVTECLHTFCKSCIVKYLQINKHCPQCGVKIHETQPTLSIKADRVMQDIIFKLVPGLYENEEKRRETFYRARGLLQEKQQYDDTLAQALTSVCTHPEAHYYAHDQLICFCLERYSRQRHDTEPEGYELPRLVHKFVRCSGRVWVRHVDELLRKRLAVPEQLQVTLLCCDKRLPGNWPLKQVWRHCWQGKASPMMLYYTVGVHTESSAESAATSSLVTVSSYGTG